MEAENPLNSPFVAGSPELVKAIDYRLKFPFNLWHATRKHVRDQIAG
jgi:hypothetical protein